MNIGIFGGLGFAGFALGQYLKSTYPEYQVHLYDNLSRRGTELNAINAVALGLNFSHCDIRCKDDLEDIKCDVIIDASADASVQSGLQGGARKIIHINFSGSLNLLDLALVIKAKFLFLSTSRVYSIDKLNTIQLEVVGDSFNIRDNQQIAGLTHNGISEEFSTQGSKSVYGATKFCVEQIIQEYAAFQGLEAIINRFGVLAGPGQFGKIDQGILMFWLMRHYFKKPLAYIGFGGKGHQVRDFLHINDFCNAIDLQLHNFDSYSGNVFNVGGGTKVIASLAQLTKYAQEITGNCMCIKGDKEDRKADIPWYITDHTKFSAVSGWSPEHSIDDIFRDSFSWIQANESIISKILI
jgi:CDP-paratose 2-epimerase